MSSPLLDGLAEGPFTGAMDLDLTWERDRDNPSVVMAGANDVNSVVHQPGWPNHPSPRLAHLDRHRGLVRGDYPVAAGDRAGRARRAGVGRQPDPGGRDG